MYLTFTRLLLSLCLLLGAVGLLAQTTLTGLVEDASGEPVIGVNITVLGNDGVGTITDVDGRYSFDLPEGADFLVFSYVGYRAQTLSIAGLTSLDVVLESDETVLTEAIVVGYGTVERRNLAGSVDQVSERRIENIPVTSLDQTLAGQVQGVQFRQGTGQPGAGAEILIRGIGSLTGDGNAPLIVIDGVPFGNYNAQTNNFLSLVNPNDIATITVVRDAAEKAIYGSRAAAGLILITTKRGRTGAPSISLNAYYGIQTIPDYERPDVLNATELAQLLQNRFIDLEKAKGNENPTIPANLANPSNYGEGTNWFDLITQNAPMSNIDLSLRGAGERTTYALSLGYTDQEGVVKESNFQRYSARLNMSVEATDWLNVEFNLAPSWTTNRTGDTESGSGQFSAYNVSTVARWADPSAPAFDENGELTKLTLGSLLPFYQANPLYKLQNQYTLRNNRLLLSTVRGTAKLPFNFSLTSALSGNLRFNNIRGFSPSSIVGGSLQPDLNDPTFSRSSASSGRAEEQRLIWETTLNYAKKIGDEGRHNLSAFVGYSTEYTRGLTFSAQGSRLLDQNFEYFNSGNIYGFDLSDPTRTPQTYFSASESIVETTLLSYLGRVRYDFDERYFVTLALRSDGSSRFGASNRFALFPSASVAWNASNETWFPEGIISNLRFEASAGLSGNNTVRDYRYQGSIGGGGYVFGSNPVVSRSLSEIPNSTLGWEETEQLDFGVQLGLLDDRITLKGTYYQQTTTGLLFSAPLPTISGFGSIFDNVGRMQNNGMEFSTDVQILQRSKWIWNVDANVSANRNEVLQLGAGIDPTIFRTQSGSGGSMSWTRVGSPVGEYYGLQMLGLYTPEQIADSNFPKYPGAVVGAPYFFDGDGDGVLERANGDRSDFVKIGSPWPDFTFGFNTNLTYSKFSLQMTSLGEVGSEILDLVREITYNTEGAFNVERDMLNSYRVGSEDYSLRAPTFVGTASQTYRTRSSTNVLDGTYWKINNITLAYNLEDLGRKVTAIQGGRLYASIQNVAVLSSFRGNPQIQRASADEALERNVRYGAYPTARVFTVGTTLNF